MRLPGRRRITNAPTPAGAATAAIRNGASQTDPGFAPGSPR